MKTSEENTKLYWIYFNNGPLGAKFIKLPSYMFTWSPITPQTFQTFVISPDQNFEIIHNYICPYPGMGQELLIAEWQGIHAGRDENAIELEPIFGKALILSSFGQ